MDKTEGLWVPCIHTISDPEVHKYSIHHTTGRNLMNIDYETLVSYDPKITYGLGHPKRPFNYDVEEVIKKTIWLWKQIENDFNLEDWYVMHLSPGFKTTPIRLRNSLPDLINRVSGAINSSAYRKGWKTKIYAALEHIDEECDGYHFHCLVKTDGCLTKRQERTLKYQVKSMRIFNKVSTPVQIRKLCPSGSFLDAIRTLHYICKQATKHHNPFGHHILEGSCKSNPHLELNLVSA